MIIHKGVNTISDNKNNIRKKKLTKLWIINGREYSDEYHKLLSKPISQKINHAINRNIKVPIKENDNIRHHIFCLFLGIYD